jgi:hypothetical protein
MLPLLFTQLFTFRENVAMRQMVDCPRSQETPLLDLISSYFRQVLP